MNTIVIKTKDAREHTPGTLWGLLDYPVPSRESLAEFKRLGGAYKKNDLMFPTFGHARCFRDWEHVRCLGIPINGVFYTINYSPEMDGIVPMSGTITFTQTARGNPFFFERVYTTVVSRGERFTERSGVWFFNQPSFIQNPVFPVWEGRLALPLCTWYNGWGDAGNVNLFLSCDENGVPQEVFHEASCH